MKTTVLYHRADFDGLFCREIARKFLPDAELIGWDYGDPLIPMPEGRLYILDLSPDSIENFINAGQAVMERIIWIDHHKTAIEKWNRGIPGYRIDGVAACRLAWQWFWVGAHLRDDDSLRQKPNATKEDFFNRTVVEPYAVRLAGEYDIWDKRDPNAELFQHGLRSCDLSKIWDLLLVPDRKLSVSEIESLVDAGHTKDLLNPNGTNPNPIVVALLSKGVAIQYAKTQENESIIKSCGFTIQFEGFCLLACNAARYNSQLFKAGLKLEHDGMIGFNWDGQQWRVSLYSDKPEIDLSEVAKKYGGGGHRGACGFRAKSLPFLPCSS